MNINNLLKSFTAAIYGISFIYLVESEKVYRYLHPRMANYVLLSGIILIIIGLYSLKDLKKNIYMKSTVLPFIVFLLPLTVGLLINPVTVSSIMEKSSIIDNTMIQATESRSEFLKNDGSIDIRTDNYLYAIQEIYRNGEKYEGKEIEVEGFIFRNEFIGENQVILGRKVISCCIADASVIGFLIESEDLKDIDENSWVKVKGKLNTTEFEGDTIPIIIPKKGGIDIVERPRNEYIFAY